jgi:hypothetical protein
MKSKPNFMKIRAAIFYVRAGYEAIMADGVVRISFN